MAFSDPEQISRVQLASAPPRTPGLLANQGCVPTAVLRGHTEGFVSSYLSQYSLCVTAARTLTQRRRATALTLPQLRFPSFPNSLLGKERAKNRKQGRRDQFGRFGSFCSPETVAGLFLHTYHMCTLSDCLAFKQAVRVFRVFSRLPQEICALSPSLICVRERLSEAWCGIC